MMTKEELRARVAELEVELCLKNRVLENIREFAEHLEESSEDDDGQYPDGDLIAFDIYEILEGTGQLEGDF
jgi:hypothetical protein